jgi:hypothetical protein
MQTAFFPLISNSSLTSLSPHTLLIAEKSLDFIFCYLLCAFLLFNKKVKVKVKLKQSLYRPGVAQRVPES